MHYAALSPPYSSMPSVFLHALCIPLCKMIPDKGESDFPITVSGNER
jgi:hypothetical protein